MKNRFLYLGIALMALAQSEQVFSENTEFVNYQQSTITVKGKVTDQNGEPIIGVTVYDEKNKTNGTITDFNGDYSLSVSSNVTIVYSYLGYKEQKIKIKDQSTINVVLKEDNVMLDEVVAIGYATKKKVTLSGSVAVADAEVFESKPVANAVSALQGVVPGLTVTRGGGQPGAEGFNLNIRGLSSINGGAPLILVDGNPVNDLNMVNPHDIESMSVLKDASASIYGSRASAGVILITTKQGKEGKPVLKFSTNLSFSTPLNKIEYPNLYEYAHMSQEADMNNGVPPLWTDEMISFIGNHEPIQFADGTSNFYFFDTTDWFDEIYGHGLQQDYNMNVSGGTKNVKYYFSVGFNRNEGMIKHAPDKADRYNMRSNLEFKISDAIKLYTMINFDRIEVDEIQNLGRVVSAPSMTPVNHPVYTQNGNWFSQGGYTNPIAMATNDSPYEKYCNRFQPTLKLDWEVFKGFKVIAQASFGFENWDSKLVRKELPYYFYNDVFAYYEYQTSPNNATYAYSKTNTRNFQLLGQYDVTIADKHELSVMVGGTHEESDYDYFDAYRDNFVSDDLFALNLGSSANMQNSGKGEHWALRSVLGRLGYIYDDKYILDASFRYDGSSKFDKDNRWKMFLSASGAWRISEENFVKDNTDFFDNLKLRLSYGEMGNQAGIGLYDYIQNINIGGAYPFGNVQRAQSATLAGMVARNRTWETLVTTNVGLDMTIFDGRLDFAFDYFWKRNKNMLIGRTMPSILGAGAPTSNNGELKSWGWELNIGWKDKIQDFGYGVNFVLSDNDNKITDLGGLDSYKLGHVQYREGHRANEYYGYDFIGIIQTEEQLNEYKKLGGVPANIGIGDAMFRDVDGNGRIDAYSEEAENGDLIILGDTNPRFNFGINLNASWKGFDLSAFFQGVGKRTFFREGNARIPFAESWYHPIRLYYNNTWSEDRPDAMYPRITHSSIRHWNYSYSSLIKENAAYIRLKNITIGYTIPKHLLAKTKVLNNVRIYFTGTDLLSFHKLQGGFDPEDGSYGTNYPFAKTFTCGLDVTF